MEDVYLCVVRVYRNKGGTLDLSGRAVIVSSGRWKNGSPVSFVADGRKYYGDVLSCTEVSEGSVLHLPLVSLNALDVRIHTKSEARPDS